MTLAVMLLVLLSAFAHAAWNAIVKSSKDKLVDTVLVSSAAAALSGAALVFLPLPAPACWPYLALSVVIHAAYFWLVGLVYRIGDMSYAYPLMRGSAPLLTAVAGGALLGEPLSAPGWVGVLLLSAGMFTLAADSWRSGHFSATQTCAALMNALVIVAYTLADGSGVRLAGNPWSYIGWMFFLNAFPLLAVALALRRRTLAAQLRARWKPGLIGGCFVLGAYGIALWAMTQAPIALVAALRETSVVFGIVIAAVMLKERFGPARYVASLLVAAGAAAIKFA